MTSDADSKALGRQVMAEKDRCRNQENLAKKRLRILNPENLTVKEFAAYRARLEEAQARLACHHVHVRAGLPLVQALCSSWASCNVCQY